MDIPTETTKINPSLLKGTFYEVPLSYTGFNEIDDSTVIII